MLYLAVHGLEGIIRQGNTFYDRWEELLGQCDFVMSNPPFNVDGVSPEKVKNDPRLFTEKKIPGIVIGFHSPFKRQFTDYAVG